MARYNFQCSNCDSEFILTISVSEFLLLKAKKDFNIRECKKCDTQMEFIRIFSSTSSKISRDKSELIVEAKEEARRVVEKIKMGDTKTILDVYGDKA